MVPHTIDPNAIAYSPRDAAAFLGLSKRTLFRLIKARKLKVRKCGPRTLVDAKSLRAFFTSLPPGN